MIETGENGVGKFSFKFAGPPHNVILKRKLVQKKNLKVYYRNLILSIGR